MSHQKPERFRPYLAVMLLLVKDNNVLLQRRFKTGYADGMYNPVSGHVDAGESAVAALVREAHEEAGITIEPHDLTFVHTQQLIPTSGGKEFVYLYFECTTWQGEPKIMEPEKHDDLAWFEFNHLPETILPYMKQAIECYRNNIAYSEVSIAN